MGLRTKLGLGLTFSHLKLRVENVQTAMNELTRITRHMHSLSSREVHVSADYCRFSFFFPMTVVLWNRLPADLVVLRDLDSFKREVSKISYPGP